MGGDQSAELGKAVAEATPDGFVPALRKYHARYPADALLSGLICSIRQGNENLISADEAINRLGADSALLEKWRSDIQTDMRNAISA
jgi:hypothetical protein